MGYVTAKHGMIGLARSMARDFGPQGVRVNTVCPGMVQTPLNRSVWQAWNASQPADRRRSYEDWAGDKVRQVVPLGRWQKPVDIADFLQNPDIVTARHIGVTIEHYRRWRDFTEDSRCTGTTKRGKRCRSWVHDWELIPCARFRFGIDDSCRLHVEQGESPP